jgi:N utilization substance protein B
VGRRRWARQCALQLLFQLDGVAPAGETGLDAVIATFWEQVDPEAGSTKETASYATRLVHGVMDHLAELDALIQGESLNWRLERMSRVDRNLLRLSTFELVYMRTLPGEIVINEAVELAREFGSDGSSSFVNGVLDPIASKLRR